MSRTLVRALELIEACLRAATKPGAGAQDIFDVAARAPDKSR